MDFKQFELNKFNHQAPNQELCLVLLLLVLSHGLVEDFEIS